MEARRQDLATSIGLLILRLGVGGLMLTHGWSKVQLLLNGGMSKFDDLIGIGSGPSMIGVVVAEFVCAILVMIGLATRFAALPAVFAMAVAAFVAHGNDPWTMAEGAKLFVSEQAKSWASKEPALLFLIPFLALAFTGAGRFSLDAMIGPRWRRRRSAHPDGAVA